MKKQIKYQSTNTPQSLHNSINVSLLILSSLFFTLPASAEIPAAPTWEWPRGAEAAISFVYDDGAYGQNTYAASDLEYFGYLGSF